MEFVVIFILFFGFMLAAAIVLLAQAGSQGSGWNQAFEFAARRFHGRLSRGGWFSQPSAWLQHGEASGRLTVFKLPRSGGERCLQMTIQQRDFRSKCEIYYHMTRPELAPATRGLSAVEFDWEEFRTRWHVLASDGDEVRHVLSDGVRLAIDQVWRHPVPGEITLSLSPGWLVVRKVWSTPRGADVEEFIERVCALHDQLNLAAVAGIEFIAGDEAQLLEAARCGVCGESLASEIVVCRRCNTPHHRDCWEYGGSCATYGCGSRECFRPGVAPLAAPHWEARAPSDPGRRSRGNRGRLAPRVAGALFGADIEQVENDWLLAERVAHDDSRSKRRANDVLLADHPEIGFLFIVVVLIVGGFVAFAIFSQHQKQQQLLDRVAQRFRGRLEPGSFLQYSQIRLRFQDYPALVKFTKVGKSSYHTHFTITWPEPGMRCEIYPQDILSGFRKLWGMEDIEIGSPQFDQAFFISGNSKQQVRELLTAEVQALIFRLTRVGGNNVFGSLNIQVKWAGGTMTVTKPQHLSTYEELDAFISLSAELFIAALHSRDAGITFVAGSAKIAEPDEGESQCQVCGESLASDLVYCSACKTPIHRECWEYFGGCATYACGNKKFLVRTKRKAAK